MGILEKIAFLQKKIDRNSLSGRCSVHDRELVFKGQEVIFRLGSLDTCSLSFWNQYLKLLTHRIYRKIINRDWFSVGLFMLLCNQCGTITLMSKDRYLINFKCLLLDTCNWICLPLKHHVSFNGFLLNVLYSFHGLWKILLTFLLKSSS